MRDRIIRIYEVDASQQKIIREEVDAVYTGHCAEMDTVFEEAKRLDETMSDYAATVAKRLRKRQRDDPVETQEAVSRRLQDDPKYQKLLDRRQEIERSCQIDWNDALRGIEKLLPKGQVLKGRERLAMELPHRCGRLWVEDVAAEDQERDNVKTVHPWETYVQGFIKRYRLDAGQIGAAKSVLREVRRQATQVDRRRFDELAADHGQGDSAAVRARIEEFELRIDDLFDELNMRLDALLTTSQRQAPAPAQQESTTPAEIP